MPGVPACNSWVAGLGAGTGHTHTRGVVHQLPEEFVNKTPAVAPSSRTAAQVTKTHILQAREPRVQHPSSTQGCEQSRAGAGGCAGIPPLPQAASTGGAAAGLTHSIALGAEL